MIRQLDPNDIYATLLYMGREGLARLPYGGAPQFDDNLTPITESAWGDLQWNPPAGPPHDKPDPVASPKPTWAQLVAAFKAFALENLPGDASFSLRDLKAVRTARTDDAPMMIEGKAAHVGKGISRMSGLIRMASSAKEAGNALPRMVLRDEDGTPFDMWTHRHIASVLDPVTDRENRVESAHNIIMEKYKNLETVRDDETLTVDERFAAGISAKEFLENYESHLNAAIQEFDRDALPKDLPTLKEKLIENLEAAAMARIKELRGAASQQRIDLPAACDDMEAAEKRIAAEEMFGQLQIERAEDDVFKKEASRWSKLGPGDQIPMTVQHDGDDAPDPLLGAVGDYYRQTGTGNAEAKREYDIAKRKIEQVPGVKVPKFKRTGGASDIPTNRARFTAREYRLTVHQPALAGLPLGRISAPVGLNSSKGSAVKVRQTDNEVDWVLWLNEQEPVIFTIAGRNLCGTNRLSIELVPPPS